MVILNACWRHDNEVTLVDNLNRIINLRLQNDEARSPIQLLTGHEVGVESGVECRARSAPWTGMRTAACCARARTTAW